jgi:hypothetical protein
VAVARLQQVKPDRIIHRLTPAGRAELDRWLAEPAVPARGYRDEFFLKLMAAVRSADQAVLPGVLSRQRACPGQSGIGTTGQYPRQDLIPGNMDDGLHHRDDEVVLGVRATRVSGWEAK